MRSLRSHHEVAPVLELVCTPEKAQASVGSGDGRTAVKTQVWSVF